MSRIFGIKRKIKSKGAYVAEMVQHLDELAEMLENKTWLEREVTEEQFLLINYNGLSAKIPTPKKYTEEYLRMRNAHIERSYLNFYKRKYKIKE